MNPRAIDGHGRTPLEVARRAQRDDVCGGVECFLSRPAEETPAFSTPAEEPFSSSTPAEEKRPLPRRPPPQVVAFLEQVNPDAATGAAGDQSCMTTTFGHEDAPCSELNCAIA